MILRPLRLSDTRLAALFLVSACVLGFEIEVMRVFAVSSWSNFGAMVISIALLGFGLAGTILTLLESRLRASPDAWITSSAYALGPSMALAHVIAQQVPFNPVLIATDHAQLWWIGAFYLAYGLPFFVGGLFIGSVFTVLSSRMHALYFWNMLGSGVGGLLVLAAMFLFPPDFLIYPLVGCSLLPALLCTLSWHRTEDRLRVKALDLVLCVATCAFGLFLVARLGELRISDFKPESYARDYPDSALLYRTFSPRGDSRVYASSFFHFAPGLSDNAAVSLSRMPRNAFLGLFVDGNGPVGIMRKLEPAEARYIDFLPMSAPYQVLRRPRVLVLKLGGGMGVQTAIHNGASRVCVVESNADLIHMMRDVPYFRAYTGDFLRDPRVRLVSSEIRAFTGSTQERFDLVEIGLIDSIGLSQAGGYSVEENYTYTVEAIRSYLRCLAPSGILSITVWDRLSPPRNVPRLLSTVVEALRDQGGRPADRLFAFGLLLSTTTILVKNGEFTPAETAALAGYCRRMSFEVDYAPGIGPAPGPGLPKILDAYRTLYSPGPGSHPEDASAEIPLNPGDLYRDGLQWLFAGRQEELFRGYIFDIRPATDDRPYYSGYIKPERLPFFAVRSGDIPEEWGYLLLIATFFQSLLFALLVALVPVGARFGELFRARRGTLGVVLYYACLGLGYMMAEIYLIQKFVFYLADPVYANSLVITILLIASGVGSLVAGRLTGRAASVGSPPRSGRLLVGCAAAGILALALLFHFALPSLLAVSLGLPLVLRALVSVVVIAPLGFLLGIPFPTGLASLSRNREGIVPWAWGVNGALSVSGSVLTRVLSTASGFSVVLGVMAGLYVAAGALFGANERQASTCATRSLRA